MSDTVQKIMALAINVLGYTCMDCGIKYPETPIPDGTNSKCPNCGYPYFRQHPYGYDDPDWPPHE